MEPLLNKTKGEHYNLRWNNYSSNLIQVFSEHQCEEKLVDVTLVCEGQYLKAHRLVLSACSVFFEDMFKNYGNVTHPFIILNGIKFCHMKYIIEFIYQGEIKVSDDELEGVLTLGENLQIKGLSSVKLKEKISEPEIPKIAEPENQPVQIPLESIASVPVRHLGSFVTSEDKSIIKNRKSVVQSASKPVFADSSSDPVIMMENSKNSPNYFTIDECREPEKKRFKKLPMIKDRPTNDCTKQSKSKDGVNNKLLNKTTENLRNNRLPLHVPDDLKSRKAEEKIPRPANAFMIFANEWRRKLAIEHPGDDNKNISVRLGNLWKSLNSEARESYYAAARQAQFQHQTKYPGWSNIRDEREVVVCFMRPRQFVFIDCQHFSVYCYRCARRFGPNIGQIATCPQCMTEINKEPLRVFV